MLASIHSAYPIKSRRLIVGPARLLTTILLGLLLVFQASGGQAQAPFEWQPATPESQGISAEQLETIRKRMEDKKTGAFLVARHDRIVCEWYAPGISSQRKFGTASLAKALVGGLSLAVAMEDGNIK